MSKINLFEVFATIGLKDDEFNKGIDEASGKGESFGFKFANVAAGVGKAAIAIGTAAMGIATKIGGIAIKSSEAASRVNDMSQQLGLSTNTFQKMDYVLSQNGASIDSFGVGMKTLQNAMAGLTEDGKSSQELFSKLGLAFEDVKAASPEEAMMMTIEALQKMPPSAEKTALALDAFGKQGMALMPILNMTTEEFRASQQAAEDLGMVMSEDAIKAGDDFGDMLDNVKGMLAGMGNQIGAQLLPSMTQALEAFIGFVQGVEGSDEKLNSAIDGLISSVMDMVPKFLEFSVRVITAIAKGLIDNAGKIVEAGAGIVSALLKGIGDIVPFLKPVTGALDFLVTNIESVALALTPLIAGFVAFKAAVAIQAIITGLSAAFSGQALAVGASTLSINAHNIATNAMAIGSKIAAAANALVSGSFVATGATAAGATAPITIFGVALNSAIWPITAIIAGVAALVVGITALIKWINKETDEQKALKKSTEELVDANNELLDSVKGSKKAYDDNTKSIAAEAAASKKLSDEIYELAAVENKTAEQKKKLAAYVDILNESMGETVLLYDEENDTLSQSREAINGLIAARMEQAKATAAQERAVEIAKEQLLVDEQLNEITRLKAETALLYEEGTRKYNKAIEDLNTQEAVLIEQQGALAASFDYAIGVQVAAKEATEAATDAFDKQAETFAASAEAQEKALQSLADEYSSYKDKATDMFDALSDKSKLSVAEMTKNLEENQRVISEWSTNIAKLAERGIDTGLLETLRAAGPESAGYVAEIVNASDEELQKLNDAFKNGGDVAKTALATSFGLNTEVVDAAAALANSTSGKLTQELNDANFYGMGGDVAQGLADGINAMAYKAEQAAQRMANAVAEKARVTLDEHSPSRVFAKIGENVGLGFVQGIESMSGTVNSAVDDMFGGFDKNITATLTPSISDIGDIGSFSGRLTRATLADGSAGAAKSSGSIVNNFNISGLTVREEADIQKIARSLHGMQMRESRGRGLVTV